MGYGDFPLEGGVSAFDPISALASLLGGGGTATATTTESPNIIANPNVSQGALSNSLIVGPQVAGAGGSAASSGGFFGLGGGAKGGAGGSNLDNINYSPSTTLVSNLPSPLQSASIPNLLSGNASQNIMTAPNMMPMIPQSSPLASLMNTTQPIAAGGISPTLAGMMAMPQQQQISGGQQIIPGTASQTGGYDQPQQQQMAMSPASMRQALSPMALPLTLNPAPTPNQTQADAAVAQYPQLQGQTGQMDNSNQPLSGGAGEAVTPSMPIDAEHQEILDQLKGLEGQAPKAAAGAIGAFNQITGKAVTDHAATTKPLKEKLEVENKALETARDNAKKLMDPKAAQSLADNVKLQVYATKSPAQKASIDRIENGTSGAAPAKVPHPVLNTLRTVGRMLQSGYGMTGELYQEETRDYNKAHLQYLMSNKQHEADQHEYDKFMEQVHQRIGDIHNAASSDLSATKSIVDDTRSALSHADQQLSSNVNMAKDMTFGPASEFMKGLSGQADVLSKESTVYGAGVSQKQRQQALGYQARNTAASEKRASTGAESYQLQSLKNQQAQEKNDLEKDKLRQQLGANQWSGKFASLKPAPGIKLDQYQDYLFEEAKAGRIAPDIAKEANRKAKIMLKAD